MGSLLSQLAAESGERRAEKNAHCVRRHRAWSMEHGLAALALKKL